MKTEKEIAKENIVNLEWTRKEQDSKGYIWRGGESIDRNAMKWICREHKASCQRFLGELFEIKEWIDTSNTDSKKKFFLRLVKYIEERIDDRKQAIKLYEDNRI